MAQASTETELKISYSATQTASEYVSRRFVSEVNSLLHESQVRTVNCVITATNPKRTLEVAPGPGRLTRDVRPAGELVCLEYNEGMIAEGKANCPEQVRWVQGNAFELRFEQEFDFLYTFRFVRHFHRADRERLYAQFRRVLKPGGWLVLDAVNAIVSEPLRKANLDDYPIYDKLYRDEAELKEELQQAGFEVVRLEPVQRWYSLQHRADVLLRPRSRLLSRWVIRALEKLRRGPALEWIVTCRRA